MNAVLENIDEYRSTISKDFSFWIQQGAIPDTEYRKAYNHLYICNYVYNNFPNIEPVVDDQLYDGIVVLAQKQNMKIPVGAIPATDNDMEIAKNEFLIHNPDLNFRNGVYDFIDMGEPPTKGKIVAKRIPIILPDQIYFQQLAGCLTPPHPMDFVRDHDTTLISRKQRSVPHTFDLCGTLKKCKYVLQEDAIATGQQFDQSVVIFDRDFLNPLIQAGFLNYDDIQLVLSLKYDGISVENTIVGDEIVNSVTRGDTNLNEASDLTPIFGGMKFPRAECIPKTSEPFGIKFEYIIREHDRKLIEQRFGKHYVNLRNAVIGLTGGLDARLYRDYLTPIPLESTMKFGNRMEEIRFLNRHFTKGLDFRWAYLSGNYDRIRWGVKKFLEEAEMAREYVDYAYDGIVVEVCEPLIREKLGKRNSIPNYSIAIKFNPMRKESTFTHYTFSIGQDGVVTPMAHFEPVEFFGAIHDKTTVHSYKRFRELNLRTGEKVTLTLSNDVIVYLTRSNNQPLYVDSPPIQFPALCPSCGQPITLSMTGDSAYCTNMNCPERVVNRMANCLKKLSFKDFSTETVRTLGITSLQDLYTYDRNLMAQKIGPANAQNLTDGLQRLKDSGITDSRLIGSLGFNNIAEKTWKMILAHMPIEEIINAKVEDFNKLYNIRGIGDVTIKTIIQERPYFLNDLIFIFNNFKYTKTPPYDPNISTRTVVFTGTRDPELASLFKECGYAPDMDGSVTKNTDILVVANSGSTSSKVIKAFKYLSQSYADATKQPPVPVTWDNGMIDICNKLGLKPFVLTVEEAYLFCRNELNQIL